MKLVVLLAAALSLAGLAGAAQAGGPPTGTTTTLTSSVNPSTVNQATTLTATVTPTVPAGCTAFVAFKANAAPLTCTGGNQSLTTANAGASFTATCVAVFPSAGPQSLTAEYPGGGACISSVSAPLAQTVNAPVPTPTLTGWATYLFVALMLGGGLWFMSRRNRGSVFPSA